jgi:hypothetical protein
MSCEIDSDAVAASPPLLEEEAGADAHTTTSEAVENQKSDERSSKSTGVVMSLETNDSSDSSKTTSISGDATGGGGRFVVVKKSSSVVVDETSVEGDLQPSSSTISTATTTSDAAFSLSRSDAPNGIQSQPPSTPTSSNLTNTQQLGGQGNGRFFQRLKTAGHKISTAASGALVAATPAIDNARQAMRTAAKEYQQTSKQHQQSQPSGTGEETFVSSNGAINDEGIIVSGDNSSSTGSNNNGASSSQGVTVNKPEKNVDQNGNSSSVNEGNVVSQSDLSARPSSSTFRGRYAQESPARSKAPATPQRERGGGVRSLLQDAFSTHGMIPGAGRQPQPLYSRPFSPPSNVMQSAAGPHMEALLGKLEEGQHVMLLGHGFMGVNLKDCYHGGVYVDFLNPGGNADLSGGLVAVGDRLVKVGDTPVHKLSIQEVPHIIAKAPRPVVIILCRKHKSPPPSSSEHLYSDVGHALQAVLDIQNKVQTERERSIATMPLISGSDDESVSGKSTNEMEHEDKDEAATSRHNESTNDVSQFGETQVAEDAPVAAVVQVEDEEGTAAAEDDVSTLTSMSNFNVGSNGSIAGNKQVGVSTGGAKYSKSVKRSLAEYASRRQFQMSCFVALKQTLASDAVFCQKMKAGFKVVCADARCLPFLAAHLSQEDAFDAYGTTSKGTPNKTAYDSAGLEVAQIQSSKHSLKLMLWLEMERFGELWPISTPQRRLDHANRVVRKFLSPSDEGTSLSPDDMPPQLTLANEFDPDLLAELETLLNNANDKDAHDDIPRDFFDHISNVLETSLCGIHFTSFLMGDSFARMRGYTANSPIHRNITLESLWQQLGSTGNNSNDKDHYLHVLLLHLLSMEGGRRYAPLATSIAIRKVLDLCQADSDIKSQSLRSSYQILWDIHFSPSTRILGRVPKETEEALEKARNALQSILEAGNGTQEAALMATAMAPLRDLSRELFWQYAVNTYPKFKLDRLFDQYCRETERAETASIQKRKNDEHEENEDITSCVLKQQDASAFPSCSPGFVPRLLRQDRLPDTVSKHRSHRAISMLKSNTNDATNGDNKDSSLAASSAGESHAEFAVVFGTDPIEEAAESADNEHRPSWDRSIRRFAAAKVGQVPSASNIAPRVENVDQLPPTLEGYATIQLGESIQRPLGNAQRVCISEDGWELYMVNFTVPNASPDFPNNWMYGVSLVMYHDDASAESPVSANAGEEDKEGDGESESYAPPAIEESFSRESTKIQDIGVEGADRYLTFDIVRKMDQIFKEAPSPVRRQIREKPWSKKHRNTACSTVGIALVSNTNTIPALRQSLHHLFMHLAVSQHADGEGGHGQTVVARGLVDLLGAFSSRDKATHLDLNAILQPYLKQGCVEWVVRPLVDQSQYFEEHSVKQLMRCLPPTAFALAFLNVLLEQKVVLTSSRRSVLLSASVALGALLKPLEWHHLQVPIAPVTMAGDLVQYPAPFLIGVPSQETQSQEVLNSLPADVSLIDLDLGRVILGTKYASGDIDRVSSTELRLQVFYLAEELGAWLGSKLCPVVWKCDDPFVTMTQDHRQQQEASPSVDVDAYQITKTMCTRFIRELVAGASSCCARVEEKWVNDDHTYTDETVVLLDEQRFLDVKHSRSLENCEKPCAACTDGSAGHDESLGNFGELGPVDDFALKLRDFKSLIETFLRGQSMSHFISSRPKESMFYS